MKELSYYAKHAGRLKAELRKAVPAGDLRRLHKKEAWRHFLVSGRHIAFYLAGSLILAFCRDPRIWIPVVLIHGFVIFGFSVLLHDVVHHAVFASERPRALRFLALAYGLPSGLAPSQFERWHLDHHSGLGSPVEDPKRHYLSPKVNARWFKALYATPALFFIYFRAAAREGRRYSPALRATLKKERRLAFMLHGTLALLFYLAGGIPGLVHGWVLPTFFVFPLAFTINRLGQHYDINPGDPRKWTTLLAGSAFWDFLFLNSGYHLEHHYFPGTPLYNLPRLQSLLQPYFRRIGLRPRSYPGILWDWFVLNRKPHSDWARV